MIFVKNLKNNLICKTIFDYLLIAPYRNKSTTKSFIKDFKCVCTSINLTEEYVSSNIHQVIIDFKKNSRDFELNTETELIKTCLENSQDYNMITQLNYVTYAGLICNI